MSTCDRCGQPLEAARNCSYCDAELCDEHRLPEAHDCDGVRNWEQRGKRFESGFEGFSEDPDSER